MPNSIDSALDRYPVEQPFKFPLLITALFVFIPALLVYWFLGDSSTFPRSLKLFFGNWISPIILWFFAASFFHLLLKRKQLSQEKQQSHVLMHEVLPKIGGQINPDKEEVLAAFQPLIQALHILPNNLLASRLSLFLQHQDDSIDEFFAFKEKEQLKGSFSLPRFMVWAIPILGFIGTVWGISNGIAHFSNAMTSTNSVTDVSSMLKENLPLVTNSLATAFDTTLLALLLSIPLMMLMISLEKQEEAYLIDVDEQWFHQIKPVITTAASVTPSTAIASGISGERTAGQDTQLVAREIKLLSTQIKALQETMEDLHETIFTDKLGETQRTKHSK